MTYCLAALSLGGAFMFLSTKPWSSLLECLWLYMISTAVINVHYSWFSCNQVFQERTLKKVTVTSILGENMAKIVGSSKITKRYQVTIPDEARKILKISVGDTLAFVEENGKVFITTKI